MKNKDNILNQSLDQIMSERFGSYSKYIIQNRALPDARDGLKPVQRRIIFAMNELGLFSDKAFKKSARIVGEVIGKYHPHGDSSIYEAMVRMAQYWKMNIPLIEMHGNKGSIDDDPAAAMRYTETRLTKISKSLTKGIKKDTVLFSPNFDDSEIEPTVLPALLPNLIVNGARGIASGYATEMPPHNLSEVIKAIIATIKKPDIKLKEIMKYIKGPDFPTGAEVQGIEGIYNAFSTGQGKIVIRSKYKINYSEKNPYIEILEIPFGVIKSKLVREIDEKRFDKNISGIKTVRDQTDRNGISIMIELFHNTNPDSILKYLLSKTSMQVYYNYNNVAIVNNRPELMGIQKLIGCYLNHQKTIQRKILEFDLKKDKRKLEIVEGFIKVSLIAKDVIDLIRNSEGSKKCVIQNLIKTFSFTDLQAQSIADLQLYKLSKKDQNFYIEEKKDLLLKINNNENILNNEVEFNNYLINLLNNFKKEFNVKRKTKITNELEKIEINLEDLVKHEDVWITVTKQGYIKRLSKRTFDSNNFQDYQLSEKDSLIFIDKLNTKDKILVFTSKGKYLIVPVYLLEEFKWKNIGKHINDFATLDYDEKIINIISINDFNLNLNLVILTKLGKIKRTKILEFNSSRNFKSFKFINLISNDEVVSIKPSNNFNKLIIISSLGKAVKYLENKIPIQSIKAKGVKAIKLSKNSFASQLVVANDNQIIGLISQNAKVKKIQVKDILDSSRNSFGEEIYKIIKSNPNIVVESKIIDNNTNIISLDKDNKISIINFQEIPLTKRNQGFSSLLKNKKSIIWKFQTLNKNCELLNNIIKNKENNSQLSIEDLLK